MANKKTSQEIQETLLQKDDLLRYSKKTGSSYDSRSIEIQNAIQSMLGYRRFVGVLEQRDTQPPTILETIVNEVNLTNSDFIYGVPGGYIINRPDLMTGLWEQAGVGVIGNNDYRTYWGMYPYGDSDQIYLVTYDLDTMTMGNNLLSFLVELRFPL